MFSSPAPSKGGGRRSTRTGRSKAFGSRQSSRDETSWRVGGDNRTSAARKWVQVSRPPDPNARFYIPTWVAVDDLTPEERIQCGSLNPEKSPPMSSVAAVAAVEGGASQANDEGHEIRDTAMKSPEPNEDRKGTVAAPAEVIDDSSKATGTMDSNSLDAYSESEKAGDTEMPVEEETTETSQIQDTTVASWEAEVISEELTKAEATSSPGASYSAEAVVVEMTTAAVEESEETDQGRFPVNTQDNDIDAPKAEEVSNEDTTEASVASTLIALGSMEQDEWTEIARETSEGHDSSQVNTVAPPDSEDMRTLASSPSRPVSSQASEGMPVSPPAMSSVGREAHLYESRPHDPVAGVIASPGAVPPSRPVSEPAAILMEGGPAAPLIGDTVASPVAVAAAPMVADSSPAAPSMAVSETTTFSHSSSMESPFHAPTGAKKPHDHEPSPSAEPWLDPTGNSEATTPHDESPTAAEPALKRPRLE